MTSTARELAFGCAVVAVISALGILMALQGWRSRIPNPDTISSIVGAYEFVESGRLPDRGVLNSFLSYVPPGATWLFVPGAHLSSDPRVTEFPGAVVLSIGTLIGVFVLGRRFFGAGSALWAVALYGLSEIGVKYVGTVGPRGHPFFFVWMVYFACEWVARRNARFLGAALGAWVAGMFVFLELAPAVFMLPVVWLIFRPPVRIRPLALVAVLALVMWAPYLRFEARRGFVDLKSQLLLQTLPVDSSFPLQCDPSLRFRTEPPTEIVSRPGPVDVAAGPLFDAKATVIVVGRRALAIGTGSLATFETVIPGIDVALLALTLCGIFSLSAFGPGRATPTLNRTWPTAIAGALLVSAVFISPAVAGLILPAHLTITEVTASNIRTLQVLLVLVAIVLLTRRRLAPLMPRLRAAMDVTHADPRALVVCLVVTWAVCLLVVEYGRGDRMSFLWPVQAVLLAAVARAVSRLASLKARRHTLASIRPASSGAGALASAGSVATPRGTEALASVGSAIILCAVMAGPVMTTMAALRDSGWAGPDAEEVGIAKDLADELRGGRRSEASIGYQTSIAHTWGRRFVESDPRYKIGADFDLLLAHPHGILNTDRCAEGVSRRDEFRVVATRPTPDEALDYVEVRPDASFRPCTRVQVLYELRRRE